MKKLTIVLALLIFGSPAYSETINPDPHFCPILKKVLETQIKKFTKGLKEKTISDREWNAMMSELAYSCLLYTSPSPRD